MSGIQVASMQTSTDPTVDVVSPCPLCAGTASALLESIEGRELAGIYAGGLGIDIEAELSGRGVVRIDVRECALCKLQYSTPAAPGSPDFYERVQDLASYYQGDKSEFEFARSLISESDRVLEVGAGAGAFARKLKCAAYTGLEFNAASIGRAAAVGITLLPEDLHEHAARNPSSYTVACAFQVLEHVPDPGKFIRSLHRSLMPGGRLIISVPSAESYLRWQTNNPLNLPPHHLTWWPDKSFSALAGVLDLRLEQIRHHPLDAVHFDSFVHASLTRWLSLDAPRVDRSLSRRLRHYLARVMVPLARRGLRRRAATVHGESVTAVFRKPSERA